ncbi:recombinase family protein [Candidatus Peregrinibacteria bacterium]|nr:recombinase family protein [Candidatus Peregrinibacteria bacterium]
MGYLNDLKTHAILVDSEKAPFVKKAFELYASGNYNFSSLKKYLEKAGLRSNYGGVLAISSIAHMLSNPFYYGVIRVKDELYTGAHKPIISKKLFDQVQEMLNKKGRGHDQKKHEYVFTGFIQCGNCGCMVTAEVQKGHNYYRCTKKKGKCDEKYVREEILVTQFIETAQKVSLPDDWVQKMLEKIEEEKQIAAQSSGSFVQNLQEQVQEIDKKLNKLLDAHLEGTIETDEYKSKKTELINAKISFQEKITDFERKGNDWLEPCRQFILASQEAQKIAQWANKEEIKIFIKKIGSNFILKGRAVQWRAKRGWRATTDLNRFSTWLRSSDSNREPSRYTYPQISMRGGLYLPPRNAGRPRYLVSTAPPQSSLGVPTVLPAPLYARVGLHRYPEEFQPRLP